MSRQTLNPVKTLWGGNFSVLLTEHNKLLAELDELKEAFRLHAHATLGAAPTSFAGTTPAMVYTAPEARKIL